MDGCLRECVHVYFLVRLWFLVPAAANFFFNQKVADRIKIDPRHVLFCPFMLEIVLKRN